MSVFYLNSCIIVIMFSVLIFKEEIVCFEYKLEFDDSFLLNVINILKLLLN